MSNKIVIIDYNMGNLRSVHKAFEKIGADAVVTNDKEIIKNASKLVLPGVGAFKDGMRHLHKLGLVDVLNEEVIENKKPFLGICLGMQLVASKGLENGDTDGLGWINGEVSKFDVLDLKVPHVGWNNVTYKKESPLFNGISDNSDFYFVHSYHFNTESDVVCAITEYGTNFVSAVEKDNIFAVQFHPEKSQRVGLRVLENFLNFKSDI